MALEKINGASKDSRLGYFFGDNAFVSVIIDEEAFVAVDIQDTVRIANTGVVCDLEGFKRLHSLLPEQLITILPVEMRTFEGVTADGLPGVTAPLETDAAYTLAYIQQENLKRVVDTVQRRAVIVGTSLVNISGSVVGDNFFNTVTGNVQGTGTKINSGCMMTFLVERGSVFNKDNNTIQGQPLGTFTEGKLLQEDLIGLVLLDMYGKEHVLKPMTGAEQPKLVGVNFGVKIIGNAGSLNKWNAMK